MDYTADLQKVDIPTLIVHDDYDQIVPIGASALLSAKIVGNATLKVYQGALHGLALRHQDRLNADLLAFTKRRRWPCMHVGRSTLHPVRLLDFRLHLFAGVRMRP